MRVVPEAKTPSSLRTLAAPLFLMDELAGHLANHDRVLWAQTSSLTHWSSPDREGGCFAAASVSES